MYNWFSMDLLWQQQRKFAVYKYLLPNDCPIQGHYIHTFKSGHCLKQSVTLHSKRYFNLAPLVSRATYSTKLWANVILLWLHKYTVNYSESNWKYLTSLATTVIPVNTAHSKSFQRCLPKSQLRQKLQTEVEAKRNSVKKMQYVQSGGEVVPPYFVPSYNQGIYSASQSCLLLILCVSTPLFQRHCQTLWLLVWSTINHVWGSPHNRLLASRIDIHPAGNRVSLLCHGHSSLLNLCVDYTMSV